MSKHRNLTVFSFLQLACAFFLATAFLAHSPTAPARAATIYGQVVISEIMYYPGGPEPANEWVELYNPTSQAVDIGGWVLTDADAFPNPASEGTCTIASPASVPAMGFTVISISNPNPNLPGISVVSCTPSANYAIDSGDNLALFDGSTASAHLIYGSLHADANFPALSGGNAGISIGLRDPMAGWSGYWEENRNDWVAESTPPTPGHTAGAANNGWAGILTTPHTITLDGVVNPSGEWQAGELLGAADGDPTFTTLNAQTISNTVKYYVTWDTEDIYVGFVAPIIPSPLITLTRQHYNVVVDTDPYGAGSNNLGLVTPPATNCNTGYDTNGKADYAFADNPSGGFSANRVVDGSWQSWAPTNSTAMLGAGNTQAEFRIRKSEIGLSGTAQPFGLYLYVCNPNGNLVAAWPPENGINPNGTITLTTRTVFDLTGNRRSPRDEASHLGFQTRSVNTTGWHTFFDEGGFVDAGVPPSRQNWYARLIVTTAPTGGNCQVTIKVHGNDLVTEMGGGARRLYNITPVNCPGLFARISLRYEDGTDANDNLLVENDVNLIPSELRGLIENSLTFYHYVYHSGTNTWDWELIPGLTRNVYHNRVAHPSGSGTGDFSPWALGYSNNAPTDIQLVRLSSQSPAELPGLAITLLALILIGVTLLIAPRMAAFQRAMIRRRSALPHPADKRKFFYPFK